MHLQPVRFGQYIPVKLEAGEHPYDNAPQSRAKAIAEQHDGVDVVMDNKHEDPQLGVATGIHKSAQLLQSHVQVLFFEFSNLIAALAHSQGHGIGIDRSLFSLKDSLAKIVDTMMLKSQNVDLPETAVSPEPGNLVDIPEARFDAKLGHENHGSKDRLEANIQNQGLTFGHLIGQLTTISDQLAPELTQELKNLNGEIQFKVEHDLLAKPGEDLQDLLLEHALSLASGEASSFDAASMLRSRARSFGHQIELSPAPQNELALLTAYEAALDEPDRKLQAIKQLALNCGLQVTQTTPLEA